MAAVTIAPRQTRPLRYLRVLIVALAATFAFPRPILPKLARLRSDLASFHLAGNPLTGCIPPGGAHRGSRRTQPSRLPTNLTRAPLANCGWASGLPLVHRQCTLGPMSPQPARPMPAPPPPAVAPPLTPAPATHLAQRPPKEPALSLPNRNPTAPSQPQPSSPTRPKIRPKLSLASPNPSEGIRAGER